jgi:hypothetical protein
MSLGSVVSDLQHKDHLLVELIHLLLGGDPHFNQERVYQFVEDHSIPAETFIIFRIDREINRMSHVLDVDAAPLRRKALNIGLISSIRPSGEKLCLASFIARYKVVVIILFLPVARLTALLEDRRSGVDCSLPGSSLPQLVVETRINRTSVPHRLA